MIFTLTNMIMIIVNILKILMMFVTRTATMTRLMIK